MKKAIISILFIFISVFIHSQTLVEQAKILATDVAYNNWFGYSVSISGNRAIVGAHHHASSKGAVYIFEFNGLNWVQTKKLMAYDGASGDDFGFSVSLSGNKAIVGAFQEDNNNGIDAGAVYFFELVENNWIQKGKYIASTPDGDAEFGRSVCIDGNTAIVGAQIEDNSNGIRAGAVYFYEYDGSNWVETNKVIASDGFEDSRLGHSVSIKNNKAIAGAFLDDNVNGLDAGAVYVFEKIGLTWSETDKIIPLDGDTEDYFGRSVALEDNQIVIGADGDDNSMISSGSAYVYHFDGLDWIQSTKLIPDDEIDYLFYGTSVSISGNKLVVSAPQDDDLGTASGSVHLYEFNGTNWTETNKLLASDGSNVDRFGTSVSIHNNKVISGSYYDDNVYVDAGSSYIYNLSGVYGHIYNDFNENCFQNVSDPSLKGRKAIINPGNIILETNNSGRWLIDSLAAGNYSITFDTSGKWRPTCANPQTFTVVHPDSLTRAPDMGFISTDACTEPEISIHMPFMRPCFPNQKIYVQACNLPIATGSLNNGYIEIALDSSISITNSSIPNISLGNNNYLFDIPSDSLFPGQCLNFWINATVNCNTRVGQTLCLQANLYPADSCVFDTIPSDAPMDFTPCSLPWDKSNIVVDGWCQNDSIFFVITNNGDDMNCYSPLRFYVDGSYLIMDSILLPASDSDTITFSGDGRTWRIEVDQHPLHPGNSHPNMTIETCGNITNWTSDLVNVLPQDDLDPIVDIYCGLVRSSYDPNDKTGYPLGITDSHYITPNGQLQYLIRFQNTGTDTAFTVVLRDTLDADLNIFSVVYGVSSHPYTFRMYGPRILEWTFHGILLPDSTTNEPKSNGFVNFRVDQITNLPNGSEINNQVGIYFDYNSAILTNETSHIINREVHSPQWNEEINIIDTACYNYIYNEFDYLNSGDYFQVNGDSIIRLDLTISQPFIDAGDDTSFSCINNGLILSANTNTQNFSWSNGVIDGISFIPVSSEMYYVIGIDSLGCIDTDSIYVSVLDSLEADFNHIINQSILYLQNNSNSYTDSWIWTIDNIPFSTQQSTQFIFSQNGYYEVCLIASNECFNDTICKQIEITTIGINESGTNSAIKVYPNPTHSSFFIESNETNLYYEITDVTGKKVLDGFISENKTILDFSGFTNGIYILQLNNQSIKLVKQ